MSNHRPKRVAVFVEAHEGFGHFNIVSQLTKKLQSEGIEVMLLSGTLNYAGAAQAFNFGDARIVHLPLVDYKTSPQWSYITPNGTLYDEDVAYQSKRKDAIKSALSDFHPDMVLTEFFPFQHGFRKHDIEAVDELFPKGSSDRPKIVSLGRDIVFNNKPEQVLELLKQHFDGVLVRGDKRITALADSQKEWGDIELPIEYVGNFINKMPEKDPSIDDENRRVVIFGGGGYLPSDMKFLEATIDARAKSEKYGNRKWDIYLSENSKKHFISDPDSSQGEKISAFDYLSRRASEVGHGMIRVFEPIDSKKFRHELANAALAVTRGGYNTTFELNSAGVPQVVVPRIDKEQIHRANRLSESGMAQIYPPHPIPIDSMREVFDNAYQDTSAFAATLDAATFNPGLDVNNHGARTAAKHISNTIEQERHMKHSKNNLLIVYHSERLKKRDAEALADNLRASGNAVTLADVDTTKITNHDGIPSIIIEGREIPLNEFDAATLRTPVEIEGTEGIRNGLRIAGIPVFQDYPGLVAGHDKMLSQRVFEHSDVPAPRTFGTMSDESLSQEQLSSFIDTLENPPYVVKACKGWNGNQVRIVDTKEEAMKAFHEFHAASQKAGSGGALVQEFIDSDPKRKSDYRVQTVVGVDAGGKLEISIVGAVKRVAQPGMLITNVSQGADMQRVSLSSEEAKSYYVDKLGMKEEAFRSKLDSGEIEVLSEAVADAAVKAAGAFGSGCMGVDIVADINSGTAKVLEVNPFAGLVRQMQEQHGFPIHAPWAKAFEDFASAHRNHVVVKEPEFLSRFDGLLSTTPPPLVLDRSSLSSDGRIKRPASIALGSKQE